MSWLLQRCHARNAAPSRVLRLGVGPPPSIEDVGGKAAVLHKLKAAQSKHAPILEGFLFVLNLVGAQRWPFGRQHRSSAQGIVITTSVFREARGDISSEADRDTDGLRDRVRRAALPDDVVSAVQAFVKESPDGRRFAVRSSGVFEDGAKSAFAGLCDSKVNVAADDIEAAVRDVWASTYSQETVEHAKQLGLDIGKLEMAVLIQEMVPCVRSSGVIFTRAPEGPVENLCVEAGWGASAVVHGGKEVVLAGALESESTRTPWHYAIDRGSQDPKDIIAMVDGHKVEDEPPQRTQRQAPLTRQQLLHLRDHALRVEALRDSRAQDIEFAVSEAGELFLLQARDDVAYPWQPPGAGKWKNTNTPCLPGKPPTILYAKALLKGLERGFELENANHGVPITRYAQVNFAVFKKIELGSLSIRTLLSFYSNKAWVPLSKEWHDKVPYLDQTSQDLDTRVNCGMERSDDELLKDVKDCIAFLEEGSACTRQFSWAALMPLLHVVGLCSRNIQSFGPDDVQQLLAYIERYGDKPINIQMLSPSGAPLQHLAQGIRSNDEFCSMVLTWPGGGRAADEAARAIVDKLKEDRGEVGDKTRDLLNAVGNWSTGYDITFQTLREDPSAIVQTLQGLLQAEGKKAADTRPTEPKVLKALPASKRSLVDPWISRAKEAQSIREDRFYKGLKPAIGLLRLALLKLARRACEKSGAPADNLENVLEVNSIDQLRDLLDEAKFSLTWEALRKQTAWRRAVVDVPEELPPRPRTGAVSGGGKRWALRIAVVALHAIGRILPENSVVGVLQVLANFQDLERGSSVVQRPPTSTCGEADRPQLPGSEHFRGYATWKYAGTTIGKARVGIEGLTRGEILVMPDTDSSLTVFFTMLAGIVTECGGTLSHAAVTARDPEYNIPCVVGLEGACSNIRTGDTLCVHGATGLVEVLRCSDIVAPPGIVANASRRSNALRSLLA